MSKYLILSALLLCGTLTACGSSGSTGTAIQQTSTIANVSATSSTATPDTVTLSWSAVTGASTYKIERTSDGTNFQTIANVSTTSYSDAGLAAGNYTYRITTSNSAGTTFVGTSGALAVKGAATPVTAPQNPSSVNVQATGAQVSISWPAVNGATSYSIERAAATGNYQVVNSTTATSYTDTPPLSGTYHYRIKAINSAGSSSGVESTSVTTQNSSLPEAPMFITSMNISGSIKLNWTSGTGVSSYILERQAENGNYVVIATPTDTSYSDSGLQDGKYSYRVKAVNSNGTSGYTVIDRPVYVGGASKYYVKDLLGKWTLNYNDSTGNPNTVNINFISTEQYSSSVTRAVGQDDNGNLWRAYYDETQSKYAIGGNFGTPQEKIFRFDSIANDGSVSGVYWLTSNPNATLPFTGKRISQ